MILYFSGTGNSAFVAERIAEATGDETLDLFWRIREGDHTELTSERPWVVVTPTYAWRIPHVVEDLLAKTPLSGSKDAYFVMTCGSKVGNAGGHLERLCAEKGLSFRGLAQVVMPENYLAMFNTPMPEEAKLIVERAKPVIDEAASAIREGRDLPSPHVGVMDRLQSGPVNAAFYPTCISARKFRVTDACTSCGTCERVCPLGNVTLKDGHPVWGSDCTHCMACICRCPAEAIEYGTHTVGLPRYTCPAE